MNQYTKIIYSNSAGSISFDVAGDFWIESITGLQTDIEIMTTQSVGQLGVTANGQAIQPKEPTFNCCIVRNIESRRAQLLAVVLPLVLSRLTFILQDGSSWYLEGYPKQSPVLSDGLRPQHFQFRFFAPYPYFRSTEQKTYQLAGIVPLWRTPFFMSGTKKISTYGENTFVRVKNNGSVPQSIITEFLAVAEVTNPEIYNVDQGNKIGINKVMASGERFRVSTYESDKDAGTAVEFISADGTSENGFRFLTPDSDLSLQVAPGGNIFMSDAAANKQNLRCSLTTAGGERHSI